MLPRLDPRAVPSWSPSPFEVEARGSTPAFVWLAATLPPQAVEGPLTECALHAFASVRGAGIRGEKVGNACLWVLQHMPRGAGAAALARIATRVRYPKVTKRIEAALNAAAEAAGLSRAALDELVVPDHGFEDGRRVVASAHGSATLTLGTGAKLDLTWANAAGKAVKAAPKAMREAGGAAKAVRALVKEVEADLAVQLRRVERLPLEHRRLPLDEWRARYVEHPLIGPMCRSLIWRTDAGAGLWRDGRLEDAGGAPLAAEGFAPPGAAAAISIAAIRAARWVAGISA